MSSDFKITQANDECAHYLTGISYAKQWSYLELHSKIPEGRGSGNLLYTYPKSGPSRPIVRAPSRVIFQQAHFDLS